MKFEMNVLLIEDIQILLAYGLKSKLKHGSQLLKQFMTREASFSASFGMPAEFRIIVAFLDPYFNHLIFHFIIFSRIFLAGFQPNGSPPISCTDKPVQSYDDIGVSDGADFSPPHRLTIGEISQVINDFRLAANHAIKAGSFLFVIHAQSRIKVRWNFPLLCENFNEL